MISDYKARGPVTLTEKQILALHQKLREMRHDVNNRLANIVAAAELARMHPDKAGERLKLLLDQPQRAVEAITQFSREFESVLGLVRK
jgi:uncharacterized membrane protein